MYEYVHGSGFQQIILDTFISLLSARSMRVAPNLFGDGTQGRFMSFGEFQEPENTVVFDIQNWWFHMVSPPKNAG